MNIIRQSLEDMQASIFTILSAEPSIDQLAMLSSVIGQYKEKQIFITGIGKPGFIAELIAANMQSVRLNASFLHPTNALHGDLGPISQEDSSLLICLSKSGKSTEMYGFINTIKQLRPNCHVLMLTFSDVKEHLDKQNVNYDTLIALPIDFKESDTYGLVPTNSNSMFNCIVTAALAQAMIGDNYEEINDFCERLEMSHPSGSLHNKVAAVLENLKA